MDNLIFKNETFQLIGLCMKVDPILGHGFSEIVYKDAIEVEARSRGTDYQREKNTTSYIKETLCHINSLLILNFLIASYWKSKLPKKELLMSTSPKLLTI